MSRVVQWRDRDGSPPQRLQRPFERGVSREQTPSWSIAERPPRSSHPEVGSRPASRLDHSAPLAASALRLRLRLLDTGRAGDDNPPVRRSPRGVAGSPIVDESGSGTLRGDPTMLVGYVSDERYVALPDVLLEFEGASGSVEARSRATGAVHADLEPGAYRVTLQKPGFGAKSVDVTVGGGEPYQFRLLADGLLGYAWPKWVRSGEKSEFRVHAVEAYKLELWRYGFRKEFVRNLGWFDEHGPRATMQITPDGDYTQTGVELEQAGLHEPASPPVRRGPRAVGPLLLPRQDGGGARLLVPLDRRAGATDGPRSPSWPRTSPGMPTTTSAAAATTSTPTGCRHAHGQRPPGAEAVHRPRLHQLRHRRLCAAVVRPPRADQPHRRVRGGDRPDRRARRVPPGAGGVAAAGLAGARRVSTTTTTPRRSCIRACSTSTPTRS